MITKSSQTEHHWLTQWSFRLCKLEDESWTWSQRGELWAHKVVSSNSHLGSGQWEHRCLQRWALLCTTPTALFPRLYSSVCCRPGSSVELGYFKSGRNRVVEVCFGVVLHVLDHRKPPLKDPGWSFSHCSLATTWNMSALWAKGCFRAGKQEVPWAWRQGWRLDPQTGQLGWGSQPSSWQEQMCVCVRVFKVNNLFFCIH